MKTHFPAAAGIHLRRSAVALAAGTLLALGSGAASAVETTFTGTASGCFGLDCVPASTTSTGTLGGLTYTNSTFNVTSAGGIASIGNMPGTPNLANLGSFTLTGATFSYTGTHFDLLVTFTAPPGTTPNSVLIKDTLTGVVTATDNGGIFIDFDNTKKHFTFGSGATAGAFDFFVNDVSLTPGAGSGKSIAASGTIFVSSVPEPETYALFLAGLGAVGFIARRRKA